jgi:hypothetical protein
MACSCQMISCVCIEVEKHPDLACRYRKSLLCPVAIYCDHGYDVCPECDPCTCNDGRRTGEASAPVGSGLEPVRA